MGLCEVGMLYWSWYAGYDGRVWYGGLLMDRVVFV